MCKQSLTPFQAEVFQTTDTYLPGMAQNLSSEIIADDVFARLQTFPNVLVTGHQAFLTDRALRNIAETTLTNITEIKVNTIRSK